MSSLEVVELVDVVGEDDVGLGMTLEVFDLLDFALERSEEALCDRVDAPMFCQAATAGPFGAAGKRRILKTSRAM